MGKQKELLHEHRQREFESEFLQDLQEPKSKLKTFDLFKEIEYMVQRVNEGYENELEAYIMFSDAEKAFKNAKESILESAIIEREKHEEKTLKMFGKSICISQSGRYTYINNPEWINRNNELKEIEAAMKNALISYKKGQTIVDENGEVIQPAIYTPSKKSLKIGI